MAKRKGRAARKQQRDKAVKAQSRGLPAADPAPKPQKTRKIGGDTAVAAIESEKAGRTRPKGASARAPEPGFPVLAKVAIGAAVALVLLYALSTFRKADEVTAAPADVAASTSGLESSPEARSVAPEEARDVPDETESGEASPPYEQEPTPEWEPSSAPAEAPGASTPQAPSPRPTAPAAARPAPSPVPAAAPQISPPTPLAPQAITPPSTPPAPPAPSPPSEAE